MLRLTLFLAVVSAAAWAWAIRQAGAGVDEAMLGFGSSLMRYPQTNGEPARQLLINGARIHFRTQTVDAPTDAVLEHYATLCDGRDADLAERLSELLRAHPRARDHETTLRSLATTTARGLGRGYVACLDMGDQTFDLDSLTSRLVQFSRSGDLHALGQARYAYAQSLEDSGGRRTFLLTMWTEADFNVYDILPSDGRDAMGGDLAEIPRPSNAQRILSSSEAGRSSTVIVYVVRDTSQSTLVRFYREAFRVRDWEILERRPNERLRINETSWMSARKGTEIVTVLAYPGALGLTGVTVLATGSQ